MLRVGRDPGMETNPDDQVSPAQKGRLAAEPSLEIAPAWTRLPAGQKCLLDEAAAVDARPRPAPGPVRRPQKAFGRRRQIGIENTEVRTFFRLDAVTLGREGIERNRRLGGGHPGNREAAQGLQQVHVDMTDRPVPPSPTPAAPIRLVEQVKRLSEQDLADGLTGVIGDGCKADPAPLRPGGAIESRRDQAFKGLFGQVRPGQQEAWIWICQESHAAR